MHLLEKRNEERRDTGSKSSWPPAESHRLKTSFSLKDCFSSARLLQKDPKNCPSTRGQSLLRNHQNRRRALGEKFGAFSPLRDLDLAETALGLPAPCPEATATTKTRRKEGGRPGGGPDSRVLQSIPPGTRRCCSEEGRAISEGWHS